MEKKILNEAKRMEITNIKKDIQRDRSQHPALKVGTKSCIRWVSPNGEIKISDPKRLKNLGSSIEALEKAIADKVEIASRLRTILGDRTVEGIRA